MDFKLVAYNSKLKKVIFMMLFSLVTIVICIFSLIIKKPILFFIAAIFLIMCVIMFVQNILSEGCYDQKT